MRIISLIIILLAMFALPTIGHSESVKIGSVTTRSFSPMVSVGCEAATAVINDSGGILNQKIEYLSEDDQGNPANAVEKANNLIFRKVRFVIGHSFSATSLAAAPRYADAKVVHIIPDYFAYDIPRTANWNAFRIGGSKKEQAGVIADYAARVLRVSHVGMIYENTSLGVAFAKDVQTAVTAVGLPQLNSRIVSSPNEVFNTVASMENSADSAIIVSLPRQVLIGVNFAEIRGRFPQVKLVIDSDDVLQPLSALSAGALSGIFLARKIDRPHGVLPSKAQEIVQKSMGNVSNDFLIGYSAVQVIAEAIKSTQSFDASRIHEYLIGGRAIPTIIGPIQFDGFGQAKGPWYAIYGISSQGGILRPDGTNVTCGGGTCRCSGGGCSKDCCAQ